jgi:hypothetical protein
MATFMSSTLQTQVSVLKAGLTWSDARLMVLLNDHKMWVEGNFRITFFMVIMFGGLDRKYCSQKKEQCGIRGG